LIRLVVALAAEARPIVRHWRLQASGSGPLPRFEGDSMELVVSGIGAMAAATAVGYLAGRGEGQDESGRWQGSHREAVGWLNVGIAGHREHAVGSVWLGSKVVEQASGRTWFPPLAFESPCPGVVIRTVADVERELADDALYEMEAAGFYPAATRFATAELVQVLKVVSDNAEAPPERLTAARVGDLVEGSLPTLETLVEGLGALSAEVAERLASPEHLEEFLAKWRFTVTQRRQLERLLRRLAVLEAEPVTPAAAGGAGSAREVLARLREAI
jgi:hypothetical protein